jgi:hypothetical protein
LEASLLFTVSSRNSTVASVIAQKTGRLGLPVKKSVAAVR